MDMSKKERCEVIRLAVNSDLEQLLSIYAFARQRMVASGNPTQWATSYPGVNQLMQDIAKKQLYVLEKSGQIQGVFVFMIEPEPTYNLIEGKGWCNECPYGTIHRLASDGRVTGLFERCFSFCRTKINNIRVDTHEHNQVMRHLLEKAGFCYCGVIYVRDGSARVAYHWVADDKKDDGDCRRAINSL